MIASDILLNRLLALRAFSRVFFDPKLVSLIFIGQFVPFLDFLASYRLMRLFFTSETIHSTTRTLYLWKLRLASHNRFFAKQIATLWRTVAYRFVDNSVVNAKFFLIQFHQLIIQQIQAFEEVRKNWIFKKYTFFLKTRGEEYFALSQALVNVV